MRAGDWWVYILELENGSWYTGISTDPRARFEKHKSGKGAKSMRLSAPFRLVCLEFVGTYSDAARREAQIKGLTRLKKETYSKDVTSLPRLEQGPAILRKKKNPKIKPSAASISSDAERNRKDTN